LISRRCYRDSLHLDFLQSRFVEPGLTHLGT